MIIIIVTIIIYNNNNYYYYYYLFFASLSIHLLSLLLLTIQAFGSHTTVISRGNGKKDSAIKDLGAHAYIDSTDGDYYCY